MQERTRDWLVEAGISRDLIVPNAARWAVDIDLDPWRIVVDGAELNDPFGYVAYSLYANGRIAHSTVKPKSEALYRIGKLVEGLR